MSTEHKSTIIYYLEMLDPQDLCPSEAPEGFDVSMVRPPSPALNRRFYEAVGQPWEWTDRLVWSDDDWRRYVLRPVLQTWVGRYRGQSMGYFELETQAEGNVEIVYFGLLPEFVGRGLGGPLLTAAVERAWGSASVRRVWLHTCTKDHPAALKNYQRRGFEIYRTERG
jgi:GNAT superfamily N-acetyltransferase